MGECNQRHAIIMEMSLSRMQQPFSRKYPQKRRRTLSVRRSCSSYFLRLALFERCGMGCCQAGGATVFTGIQVREIMRDDIETARCSTDLLFLVFAFVVAVQLLSPINFKCFVLIRYFFLLRLHFQIIQTTLNSIYATMQ